jgi:inosine-uridine nucleoside N-ribohydrolase
MTRRRRLLRTVGAAGLVLLAAAAITLALPIEAWRTGEPPSPELMLAPGRAIAAPPARIWVDTDAACGAGARTDPDDCLAMLLLVQSDSVRLAGVSTVFGNAPLETTDRTTRALMNQLGDDDAPVFRGAGSAGRGLTVAARHLRAALAKGPLTIVALGPLTNVAAALRGQPGLQANVVRLVAVMGRRQGHLFHPVEGGTANSFLGHGPVFRDFNFAQDEQAIEDLLAMRLPILLVPYEAAREMQVTGAMLAGMTTRGGAARWVAARSRAWLGYWQKEIGVAGFYPFDLIAAAFAVRPSLLLCGSAKAWVGRDTGVLGLLERRGLFVAPAGNRDGARPVTYCPDLSDRTDDWLAARLKER